MMVVQKTIVRQVIIIFISLLSIFVIDQVVSSLLLVPICFLSVYFLNKQQMDNFLLLSLLIVCIPNTLVFYVNSLIISFYYLLKLVEKKKSKFSGSELLLIAIFSIGLLAYLFTQVIDLNPLSFALNFTTFLSAFIYFFLFKNSKIESQKLIFYLTVICIVQIIIAYVVYIGPTGYYNILTRNNATPDEVKGTFHSANSFGLLCLIAACATFYKFSFKKIRGMFYLFFFILFLAMAFLADIKSILIGLLSGLVFLLLIRTYLRVGVLKKITLIIVISLFSVSSFNIVSKVLEPLAPVLMTYVDGENNHKYLYIKRTFEGLGRNWFQYLIGTGPGTCGSRAANARAYDSMYKKEGSMALTFLPPKTSPYAKEVLVDLYQYDYAVNSRWRSALLGNPFNSFTAIFLEFGLIGFIFFMLFHFKILFLALKIELVSPPLKPLTTITFLTISSLMIMGWMDQSYEQPFPMFILMTLSGITISKFYETKQTNGSSSIL